MNICFSNTNDQLLKLFTSKTKEKKIGTESATIYALKCFEIKLIARYARVLWISF